jgi:hypothetical protein
MPEAGTSKRHVYLPIGVCRRWVFAPTVGLLAWGLVSCGFLKSETINFYSPFNKTNVTSSGGLMDAGYEFQLGVFADGFIPTRDNFAEWAVKWSSAESAIYDVADKAFDSNYTVISNTAPFTVGADAYVWGRSSGTASDEWILFRKADWSWPVPELMNPFPLDWNVSLADQVVIGAINPGGTPFLMQSDAVMSYGQWQEIALSGESLDAPGDDPDLDGFSNLLEFVFGTGPLHSDSAPLISISFIDVDGQNYLQASIPRLQNRLANLTVEVSSDLISWQCGSGETVTLSSSPESLVVRDLTPVGPGQSGRYMRLKAELP